MAEIMLSIKMSAYVKVVHFCNRNIKYGIVAQSQSKPSSYFCWVWRNAICESDDWNTNGTE
jgi:hypothetical protein